MANRKNEVLHFTGNLNICQAEEMVDVFKKCREGNSAVTIDLKDAEDIDFAVIQLLYSFKKTLNEEKRKVIIKDVCPKIEARIQLCDFQDLLSGS
ncbi:STAS domain-containing protein [Oceanispirochaeta crateris]|uniref:STAS domain-containing protein n=1 Tax=Oceanispirochaeta crateris TaxID=2518645 RepID=A0A5C1QJV2_9SPIO|nr:STAS domain-containing protein [Oceanispirochaeta crateris]QEN07449.1 STAS domain-containing protein [Oceanispirochaeta crateris]